MKNKLIRFFEHERVSFEKEYVLTSKATFTFEKKHQEALLSYYDRGGSVYYDLMPRGFKLKQFVGVLQIRDLTIEVLPKIDNATSRAASEDEEKKRWHNILMDMVKCCRKLTIKSSQKASLQLYSNSLLDLYFEIFISELEELLFKGLVKKYRATECNLTSLKGNLLFSKQIQLNLVHKERFYTRHTTYDKDHLLHQVIRQALELVDSLVFTGSLKSRIKSLLLEWPEGPSIAISQSVFDKLVLDRKTKPYEEAVLIAKMLLLNYQPDIKGGNEHVLAIMFDMNRLWEEFIAVRLRHSENLKCQVYTQSYVDFWTSNEVSKRVKPDLVIELGGKRIVIDTKWKCPDSDSPADDDLKQMLVYKLYYHADHALLLYPTSKKSKRHDGHFENRVHSIVGQANLSALKHQLAPFCDMAFINLLTPEGGLQSQKEFETEIREKLNLWKTVSAPSKNGGRI